jgi:type II secretory pathway pseudopilin PulG
MTLPIAHCRLPNGKRASEGAPLRAPIRQSAIRNRQAAFTLIEMLTTVAVLIIVLGLMVSLARNVRDQSAQQLTKQLLRQLAALMNEYADANRWQLPPVTPVVPLDSFLPPEEPAIELLAKRNNEEFVRALRPALARLEQGRGARRTAADGGDGGGGGGDAASTREPSFMGQLPMSVYDGLTLRDAWGSPIVFMPAQHPWIGMAPKGPARESAFFFFSAGPDRRYLTRDDNMYSYETVAGEPGG